MTLIDFESILRENHRRFRAKWTGPGLTEKGDLRSGEWAGSGDPRPARTGDHRPGSALGGADTTHANGNCAEPHDAKAPSVALDVDAAPGGGLRLRRRLDRPRLSLCMIVRDNARTLPACLESIRPWVDEMVIVDTGSVDETPRIVESFGGRLFHFPWCDDFSAARNESLRHALGDWLFWMDSDDTIPLECGRGLRALAYGDIPAHVLGFTMQVHCPGYGDDGEPDFDVTMVDHVKLFRNRPDLRFDHRIHEQVLPAMHEPELRFREAVMHQDQGRLDEARRAYLDVLNHHGEERHFSSVDRALTGYKTRQNLAVLALEMGDLAEAEQHWREVVRAVPYYRQGWRGLSETLLRRPIRGLGFAFPESLRRRRAAPRRFARQESLGESEGRSGSTRRGGPCRCRTAG